MANVFKIFTLAISVLVVTFCQSMQLPSKGTKRARLSEASTAMLNKFIANRDLSGMRTAIDLGADVNALDENGETPLHHAASDGLEIINLLLDEGAYVNATDDAGNTPLVYAVTSDNLPGLRRLLNAKADPDIPNLQGDTAVHFAAATNHGEILAELLSRGADPNVYNFRELRPLDAAFFHHNAQAFIQLLLFGASLEVYNAGERNAISRAFADEPLILASILGDKDAIERFVESNPEIPGETLYRALRYAAVQGRDTIVRYLLSILIRRSMLSREELNPILRGAVMSGRIETVIPLIDILSSNEQLDPQFVRQLIENLTAVLNQESLTEQRKEQLEVVRHYLASAIYATQRVIPSIVQQRFSTSDRVQRGMAILATLLTDPSISEEQRRQYQLLLNALQSNDENQTRLNNALVILNEFWAQPDLSQESRQQYFELYELFQPSESYFSVLPRSLLGFLGRFILTAVLTRAQHAKNV